ncbi:MAG: hypothetical protein JNM90_09195 [Burkholderiales bacterium]|nr:hypothetical protein [Burkholderiales bacterium]
MPTVRPRPLLAAVSLAVALAGVPPLAAAQAPEASRAIEELLAAAQKDKKGVSLGVGGQTVAGAVVRIESGKWVELRNQQYGRIVVRLDRIDSAAMP